MRAKHFHDTLLEHYITFQIWQQNEYFPAEKSLYVK